MLLNAFMASVPTDLRAFTARLAPDLKLVEMNVIIAFPTCDHLRFLIASSPVFPMLDSAVLIAGPTASIPFARLSISFLPRFSMLESENTLIIAFRISPAF